MPATPRPGQRFVIATGYNSVRFLTWRELWTADQTEPTILFFDTFREAAAWLEANRDLSPADLGPLGAIVCAFPLHA